MGSAPRCDRCPLPCSRRSVTVPRRQKTSLPPLPLPGKRRTRPPPGPRRSRRRRGKRRRTSWPRRRARQGSRSTATRKVSCASAPRTRREPAPRGAAVGRVAGSSCPKPHTFLLSHPQTWHGVGDGGSCAGGRGLVPSGFASNQAGWCSRFASPGQLCGCRDPTSLPPRDGTGPLYDFPFFSLPQSNGNP